MRCLIQDLSLNAYSYLDLFIHASNSSLTTIDGTNNVTTRYWVKNRDLSFVVSIKSMDEFAWYRVTCLNELEVF